MMPMDEKNPTSYKGQAKYLNLFGKIMGESFFGANINSPLFVQRCF
jgi:hypothetical protein